MTGTGQIYDGSLISELGAKRYLKARSAASTSNVNFFIRGNEAQKAWEECSFGCHNPSYRVLKRNSTYAEQIKAIESLSPALAGIADGVHHEVVGKIGNLAGGVKRTAEGLMLNGNEAFQSTGDENLAVYGFAKGTIEKAFSFELDILNNPLTQTIMTVILEYISLLPEWVVEKSFKDNTLNIPDKIDSVWLLKAASLGIIKNIDTGDLERAARALNEPVQKFAGKQLGKKLAIAMGAAIATSITKSIMKNHIRTVRLKNDLVKIRRAARSLKGGLGGTLMVLLHTQGFLNKAGESSRKLQQSCPRLWGTLRYQLNGANMIYFLVEDIVEEYVDRLALLENNPQEFVKVMAALIKSGHTSKIFFPC